MDMIRARDLKKLKGTLVRLANEDPDRVLEALKALANSGDAGVEDLRYIERIARENLAANHRRHAEGYFAQHHH